MQTAYRIDTRLFGPGDLIPPPGDHLSTLTGGHLEAEQLVRQFDANFSHWRANYLFTFRDEDEASSYWVLRGARYLYRVAIDPQDILFVGDMEVFNRIGSSKTPEERADWVRRYCKGEESENKKRIEIIARRARVCDVLHTPAEQPYEYAAWKKRLLGQR